MKIISYVFGGFLRQSIYDQKKRTVVWPSVGMFGGSMSLDCFGGFHNQITTEKKLYSRLAISCNVGLFWRVRPYVFWQVPWSNYKLRPKKKGWSVHIPSFSETRSPWTVCTLGVIPEQGKKLNQNSLFHSSTAKRTYVSKLVNLWAA